MPQPTPNDVHVDAILTNISTAYIQNPSAYTSSQVFPVIPVDHQSDKFYTYTKADWFRDEAQRRADGTESAGSGYTLGTDNYSCDTYAFHKDVSDRVRANADNPIQPDRDATMFVTQRMMLRQEIQWVSEFFTTSVWATDVTPTNLWSDFAASDPIEDIETGKETILSTTGYMPNTLVLGYQVARKLRNHPDIVDRVKWTSSQNITMDMLARMFEVDRIIVARAIKNTANEGQTASYSFTHGKHAWLGYVNPTPGLMQPTAGYTFMWKGVSEGLGTNVGISRFRMPHLRVDRIEAQMSWDYKVVGSDLGYFFNGAVA